MNESTSTQPAVVVGVLVGAVVLLRLFLWRAVLFIAPTSMRIDVDSPPGMASVPASLEPTHDALLALGLTHLGTHLEHPRFGRAVLHFDYADATRHAFASLHAATDGAPRLAFVTPTEQGFALTANWRLRGRDEKGRYVSGGLDGVSPERLFKAHLRRMPEAGTPRAEWTLEGRVAAARTWYAASGKADVRQQNAVGLLWTLGALGMVAAAFFRRSG